MPHSGSNSTWASSGNEYRDDIWWNSTQRHRPQLFSNLYQGQYPVNPQQQYWGNRNIMGWIQQPPVAGWYPIYPPNYRSWR
ncbi:hypothetical protein DHEL01_v201626 [Diaporthe helianthi]|uniref:Uncharacterized protein n=1 Tax=Diaporthe helianthi TaxID=158607 RepID=A0A2P5IBV5_DIAHE|nr:hypothetical protein DHEL01_v201626 [Diaporthe helianthi]